MKTAKYINTLTSLTWPKAGVNTYSYESTVSSWIHSSGQSKWGIESKYQYSGKVEDKSKEQSYDKEQQLLIYR